MKSTDLRPNHRILIVDDNPSIHTDFRDVLAPSGGGSEVTKKLEAVLFEEEQVAEEINFELHSAYQGQEALAMVEQSLKKNLPYAMAFVDVRMPPGWDGVETISRIWKVYPELQIVICTAYSDYSWEEMRTKVGQPDSLLILKKPFDNVEVRQIAHALTKKWLLNQQARLQIEELAHANKLLAMSEERFSKAFHESPLPSGIQSLPDQVFLDVNQRLAEISGYKREEMIGHTPSQLYLWDAPVTAELWYQRLLLKSPVRDEKANIRHRDGSLHETLVSLSPVTLADKPHVLLLAEDVSERAKLERQLRQAQKMEAIGQLAAGVAHDFNNILTVIQGYAGLVQHKLTPEDALSKPLHEINTAATRAAVLIRQLLMFSRKQVMQFQHLDLNETIHGAIKMLQRMVGEHVHIEFKPQAQLPAIHADTSMLEQIVMNLAVNARDAMPNGGHVHISTSVETVNRAATHTDPSERRGDYICLSFRDTGTGMDAEILNRIFEPFFTTKPVGKGTGLGLSTVFGIMRQHQGWVNVESKVGEGTTFRIYFPPSPYAAEKIEMTQDTGWRGGSETVLVAEDEDALRQIMVEVLKLQGYTVIEAATGRDALEKWDKASQPVDLLVTDMVMPGGIMGNELAARLISRSSRLKVIYTSGYRPGSAGKDISFENQNFLAKPFSIKKLAQVVRECLDTPSKQN